MKKVIRRVLSLLLITLSMSCILSVQATGLKPEQIIVYKSTYNKDGKFVMPVYIGASGRVSASLTDSNNNVIETFTMLLVEAGTTITYKKSFSGVNPGVYYLNVKYVYAAKYGLGEKEISRRLKITHSGPPAKLSFIETYQTYTDSGDIIQVFKFDYFNANGKRIDFEVYDEYGNLIHKSGLIAKHVNGGCFYNWNYYPSKGGLRASNGMYVLKYWIKGQTPKQMDFEVNLAEG